MLLSDHRGLLGSTKGKLERLQLIESFWRALAHQGLIEAHWSLKKLTFSETSKGSVRLTKVSLELM